MTIEELKDRIIGLVETKLALKAKKKILFIKVAKNGDTKFWSEILFWHPGEHFLFAYRFGHEGMKEGDDGSIGPFTVVANHRTIWKKSFSFIDKIESGIKWTILEDQVLEVKNIGADEFGFYYFPQH